MQTSTNIPKYLITRTPQRNNEKVRPEGADVFGCDVGLEPTTPRTTIWCSTN